MLREGNCNVKFFKKGKDKISNVFVLIDIEQKVIEIYCSNSKFSQLEENFFILKTEKNEEISFVYGNKKYENHDKTFVIYEKKHDIIVQKIELFWGKIAHSCCLVA